MTKLTIAACIAFLAALIAAPAQAAMTTPAPCRTAPACRVVITKPVHLPHRPPVNPRQRWSVAR
jgi:hypothetical protein